MSPPSPPLSGDQAPSRYAACSLKACCPDYVAQPRAPSHGMSPFVIDLSPRILDKRHPTAGRSAANVAAESSRDCCFSFRCRKYSRAIFESGACLLFGDALFTLQVGRTRLIERCGVWCGQAVIESILPGGFRINSTVVEGPVIVYKGLVLRWQVWCLWFG